MKNHLLLRKLQTIRPIRQKQLILSGHVQNFVEFFSQNAFCDRAFYIPCLILAGDERHNETVSGELNSGQREKTLKKRQWE